MDGSATEDVEQAAREYCLRQLAARPRTRFQLAQALARRRVPDHVTSIVLDRLVAVGLVDDESFAREWVRSRLSSRGLAPRALLAELRTRGIDDDIARAAVAAVDRDEEVAAAHRLAAGRLRRTPGGNQETRLRGVVATLLRRGHPPGLAFAVAKEALAREAVEAGGRADPCFLDPSVTEP